MRHGHGAPSGPYPPRLKRFSRGVEGKAAERTEDWEAGAQAHPLPRETYAAWSQEKGCTCLVCWCGDCRQDAIHCALTPHVCGEEAIQMPDHLLRGLTLESKPHLQAGLVCHDLDVNGAC